MQEDQTPPLNLPDSAENFFLKTQRKIIEEKCPLIIIEKARQTGITLADAFDSVIKATFTDARLDVWVTREHLAAKTHWPYNATYQQFVTTDLLVGVKAVLSRYARWSL